MIIQGSSRSTGNTNKIVHYVEQRTGFDIVDLSLKLIQPFDYDFKNYDDDFIPLMRQIVQNYDTLIFAGLLVFYERNHEDFL